jgi:hypothetical protein
MRFPENPANLPTNSPDEANFLSLSSGTVAVLVADELEGTFIALSGDS